jgi:hypothetical protein
MKCYKLFSVQAIITGLLLSTPSFAGITDDAIASALEVAEVCLQDGNSEVVLDILNDINNNYGAAEEYMMFAERHENLKKQAIALRNRVAPVSAAAAVPSEETLLPSADALIDDILGWLDEAEQNIKAGESQRALTILKDINSNYGATEAYMMFAERHADLKKQATALRDKGVPVFAAAVAPSEEKLLRPVVVTCSPSRYVVHSFRELLDRERLAPGALLTIDVDATLLHKKREMNSEQATPEMSVRYANFLEAVEEKFGEQALFSFVGAGISSPMRTEDDIPNVLAELSRRGDLLVPFTVRQHTDAEETEELLKDLGYRFENWNQGKASIPDNFYDGVTVVNGMIFATKGHKDAGHKDRALEALIRHYEIKGILPTAFCHVDDTKEHVDQMAELIQRSPRPVSLIHYQGGKYLDRKEKVKDHLRRVVQNFDRYEDLFDTAFN